MIKLLGILLVAVGLALRWNTLAVVLAAGILSGLLAGLSFHEILAMMGQFFVDNRGLLLPVILMVPVVGVLERHGLQERVGDLIRRARGATAGRILWIYQALRGGSSVMGINIGNHASMIRPLIVPMGEAAAEKQHGPLSDDARQDLRAHAAAAENVGNFFSDDIVVAIGALLLIDAFFRNAGVEVRLRDLQLWSLPTAGWVLLVGAWRYRALRRRLERNRGSSAKDGP
jgi:uncharacterized membrane protein